jgi:hypothetical protein
MVFVVGSVSGMRFAKMRSNGAIAPHRSVTGAMVDCCSLVVSADVSRSFGSFLFFVVCTDHNALDEAAGISVNRMDDIGSQFRAAVTAKSCPKVVFARTLHTAIREFVAWHFHNQPVRVRNDFQIPDDKGVVKRDRTERKQSLPVCLAQLDADFCDNHRCSPR